MIDAGTREAMHYWLEENHNLSWEEYVKLGRGKQRRLWNEFLDYLFRQKPSLIVDLI